MSGQEEAVLDGVRPPFRSSGGGGSAVVADCWAGEILRVPIGEASLVRPRLSLPAAGRSSSRMRSASPGMAKAACDRKKAGILRELRLVCSSWKLGSNPASEGESPATWLRRASNWLRLGRRGKPTMCSPAGKRNLGEAAICTAAGEAGLSEDVPGLARFCLVLPSGTAAVPEVDRNTVSGAGRFGVSVVRESLAPALGWKVRP